MFRLIRIYKIYAIETRTKKYIFSMFFGIKFQPSRSHKSCCFSLFFVTNTLYFIRNAFVHSSIEIVYTYILVYINAESFLTNNFENTYKCFSQFCALRVCGVRLHVCCFLIPFSVSLSLASCNHSIAEI